MPEQAGHGVASAVGILNSLAEHHVAAALAVNGARRCKALQPIAETLRSGELFGEKFGIAARQPARITRVGGRFVGERENEKISAPARRQPATTCS